MWGNAGVTSLPNSGIVVIIGSRAEVRAPGDPRVILPVDIAVETSWAAYAAGRDSVLEAAGRDSVLEAALEAVAEAGSVR